MRNLFSPSVAFLLLGLAIPCWVSPKPMPQNAVREPTLKRLIERIDQEREDFKSATQNAPEPSQAEGTFKAAQIDQVLDRYRNDLRITQVHHEMIAAYSAKCISSL